MISKYKIHFNRVKISKTITDNHVGYVNYFIYQWHQSQSAKKQQKFTAQQGGAPGFSITLEQVTLNSAFFLLADNTTPELQATEQASKKHKHPHQIIIRPLI